MFRYLTAGESHGPALVGILDGLPAQLHLDADRINAALAARQGGHGRGARMKIESDTVEFLAGVRGSKTLGSPIAVAIRNRDFENVRELMDPLTGAGKPITNPRPGHADYAGALKYRQRDLRNVLERASARETAMRVCLGAICAQFLEALGVTTASYVHRIGSVEAPQLDALDADAVERSAVRCPDEAASNAMIAEIDRAKAQGDTLGGQYVVRIEGLPAGIGSNRQPGSRLDGILAGALMGMQTVKAVEVGLGAGVAARAGSQAHDHFAYEDGALVRPSNRAGGIEGGMSNGEDIVVRLYAKPIPTAARRAETFDLATLEACESPYVRSDICVIPVLAVIAESVAAWEILAAVLEKLGGDTIDDTIAARDRVTSAMAARLAR